MKIEPKQIKVREVFDSYADNGDDYQNGDYIHLNSDGFTAVLNYLRTHAYQ